MLTGCETRPPPLSGTLFLMATADGLFEVSLTGERRPLVSFTDGSSVLDPSVSPDGRRLAFIRQPPATVKPDGSVDFGSDLYVSERDGRRVREVVRHQQVAEFIRSPAWLSDDVLLIAVRGRDALGLPDARIEQVDLRTGARTRFISNAAAPVVSPDRTLLAYIATNPLTQDERLMVANINNAHARPLVARENGLALLESVVFSPDGTRLAFAAVDLTGDDSGASLPASGSASRAATHPFAQDIWVVNTDGSGLRRVADLGENVPSITWSPDGSTLYVLGPSALWRVDLASGVSLAIGPGAPLSQIVLVR
jgi:Tol biopolymer transport system component